MKQLELFPPPPIPKLPSDMVGKVLSHGGYTRNAPRQWTPEEVAWCLDLRAQGYKTTDIAESVGRDATSVSIKLKRAGKRLDTYNAAHLKEKYAVNAEFVEEIEPKSVLDVYCGVKKFYSSRYRPEVEVFENDKDESIAADSHDDALVCCCKMYAQGRRFDIVDLDPFGSASDCFDLAMKMARKGICVTFGELGHRRWKRLDYVSRHYGITRIEDFTIENLYRHLEAVAARNKKRLELFACREWQNIGRVYAKIYQEKMNPWEKKTDK